MCNDLTNDTQSSRNKHFIISILCILASTEEGGAVQEVNYIYAIQCPTGPLQVPHTGFSNQLLLAVFEIFSP